MVKHPAELVKLLLGVQTLVLADTSLVNMVGSLTSHFSINHSFFIGEEYIVVGQGNVQMQSSGRNFIFLNAYYILSIGLNLLSVSHM